MEVQNKKSEFIVAMSAIVEQVNELVKKYPECGAVVLANDSRNVADKSENTILCVFGKGKPIVESIAEFTINPQLQHFMKSGLKVGMLKRMFHEPTGQE